MWDGIFPLATNEEMYLDDLCPTKTAKVIEETFLRTMKQELIWNATGGTAPIFFTVDCSLIWVLSMKGKIQVPEALLGEYNKKKNCARGIFLILFAKFSQIAKCGPFMHRYNVASGTTE